MAPIRNANDPGAAVRFRRWWKGYQVGDIARFDTETARLLVDGQVAAPYRPTKQEAAEDERKAADREAAYNETVGAREMAIAARQGRFAGVEK